MVRRFAANHDAPCAARVLVEEVMDRLRGAGDERRDDAALAVSEMVANAVVHGPPGEVELRVSATQERMRLEVQDGGNRHFGRDGAEPGHWGLGLIAEFSDRFGIEREPTTLVWCEFDLG